MFRKLFALAAMGLLSASLYAAEPAPTIEKVDINTADAATLDRVLEGVGPKKAAAIVKYRTEHGPFKKLEDLDQVKGFGANLLAQNKDRIIFSEATPQAPAPHP